MREWASIYLKGFFMGTADTLPGVSGGTIALITGIYERLIAAITGIDPRLVADVLRPYRASSRAAVADGLRRMDAGFLVALGVGMVSAVVTVSHAVDFAYHRYTALTMAFFFGLIAASAVVLYGEVSLRRRSHQVVALAGVVIAASLTGVTAQGVPHALPVVLLAGAVAISAMVLPGVSGAFLLLALGQYEYMLSVLSGFTDGLVGLANGGAATPVVENGVVVATFLAGAVVGLLTVAHAVRWALAHHRGATLTFLVSLMVGALRLPATEITANADVTSVAGAAPVVAVALAGAGVVLAIDHFTDDLDYA